MSSIKSASKKKRATSTSQRASARKSGSAASSSSSSSAAAAAPAQAYASADDPDSLAMAVASVEELIEQSDIGAAERLLRSPALLGRLKAADIGAQHEHLVPPMELLAQVLMEKGKTKEAFTWLRASCQLQPDGGAERWMYYGQLIGGRDAVQAFKQGITCMLKSRAAIVEKQAASRARALANAFTLGEHEADDVLAAQLAAMDKQISSGYTSMAELYVTDLCDDDGAERECEKLLSLALASCPDSPDALYASANLRTIQGRVPEAEELIGRCLAVLKACRSRSIEQMGVLSLAATIGAPEASAPVDAAINLYDVSYELRVAVAKLALELGALKPSYELLDQLLEEDDRVVEVSHLAAVAAHSVGEHRAALAHVDRALELLGMEEADSGMMGDDDDGDDEQEEQDEEGVARHREEIEASKRALTLLRIQCVEGAKTQPEGDDDEEEEEGGEEEGAAAAAAGDDAAMDE